MHVGQFLFYNTYIPSSIRLLVDKYYSTMQNNENTSFNDQYRAAGNEKLQSISRRDLLFNYLINDDIQLSANSSYVTLNDLFDMSTMGSLVDKTISTEGALKGAVSESHANYRNMFAYSLWERTEPMSINIKITLYSKTDPLIDVVIPTYMIMSHAGLDKFTDVNGDNQFAVPGISFLMSMYLYKKNKFKMRLLETEAVNVSSTDPKSNDNDGFVYREAPVNDTSRGRINPKGGPKKYFQEDNTQFSDDKPFNSKLFSLLIDGLVYLDKAYIKSISATFSKHTAKSNESGFIGDFPIWTELDVQIESLVPAISSMLWDALSNKGSNILNQKRAGG
jgi:hypothetical protein